MALNQLPDFSYRGEVPTAAIINAYQQKAAQEEQMRMNQEALKQQKINNVAEVFKAGAGIVDSITQYNKQQQMKDAQAAIMDLFRSGTDQVLTDQTTSATSGMVPQMTEAATTQDYSKSPEYRQELQALVSQAYPEAAGKEVAEAAFAGLAGPKAGTLSGRDIQQKNVILNDGRRVSLQLLETTPSEKYGTQFTWTDYSGNEIDPQTLEGAVEAPAPGTAVDQFGNPIIFEKVGNNGARRVGTSTPGATADKIQDNDPDNAFLRLQQKAPTLAKTVQESVAKTTLDNPAILAKVESVNASKYANSILKDPKADETELRSVYTYIARAVEKGALTEADKEAFSEALSLLARGENAFYKHFKGSAGPIFRASLIRLQTRLEQRGTMELKNKLATEKLKTKKQLGKTWEPGLDSLYPTVEELTIEGQNLNPDAVSTNFSTMSTEDLFKALGNQ